MNKKYLEIKKSNINIYNDFNNSHNISYVNN